MNPLHNSMGTIKAELNRSKNGLILFDLILINLVYFTSYFVKTSSMLVSSDYLILYMLILFFWVILSFYHNKYIYYHANNRGAYMESTLWVAGSSLFFITLTMAMIGMLGISRLFLLYTLSGLLVIELILGSSLASKVKTSDESHSNKKQSKKFRDVARLKYILPSAAWLVIIFFSMVWLKTSEIHYYQGFEKILLVLYGSWALATVITYRYRQTPKRNIYYYISPYLKSGILMILFVSIIYFFLRLEPLSRFLLFGTAIIHSGLEVIAFSLFYLVRTADVAGERAHSIVDPTHPDESLIPLEKKEATFTQNYSLWEIVKEVLPSAGDHLKQLFDATFNARVFEKQEVSLLSTQTVFNIGVLEKNSLYVLINLERINNLRRINRYFLSTHQKIKAGGWLVGEYTALEDDRSRLRSKMPKLIFSILYPGYFLIHRVFPKIPYVNNIYFAITKGKSRKLSRAELLGRLAYCGFTIIEEKAHKSVSCFIAQKTHTSSDEENPSYGPIIHLERIGYHGERVNIYKFRTMHPYSEYIQKEVYEQNDLNESGKLKNDFRITVWGKYFRKFWIDELPQILNWFRGDVAIVGVRALSEHYFSLYPKDLQELRTKFKPGLIPPYYADLPKNFEEILESEKKYLLQKQEHPLRTDFTYFWKAFYNIVIRGARSQ